MSESTLQDSEELRHRTRGERFRDALLSGLPDPVVVAVNSVRSSRAARPAARGGASGDIEAPRDGRTEAP